jgi:hypothetical protein
MRCHRVAEVKAPQELCRSGQRLRIPAREWDPSPDRHYSVNPEGSVGEAMIRSLMSGCGVLRYPTLAPRCHHPEAKGTL